MILSSKQKMFIEEYLACWNATKAAEAAGYKHPRQQGSRLLTHVDIMKEVRKRLDEQKMSADEVLKRLREQATADFSEFIDDDGYADWPAIKKAVKERGGPLVKKVIPKGDKHVVEFYDAQVALTLIGKHHRLFTDKVELTGEKGAPIKIEFVNDWRKTD